MKLAIGFITYNESSSSYLSDFLKSLKEALDFSGLSDYIIYGFENSDLNFRDNDNFIKDFLALNPDFHYQQLSSNGKNLGFAKPYNLMIEKALSSGAEYFLVINPDVIFSRESIKLLIEPLLHDNNLSATAPRIMSFNSEKSELHNLIDSFGIGLKRGLKFFDICQGEKYLEEKREQYLFQGKNVLAPSGAAGLYRLKALEKVVEIRAAKKEYFDERFFMYKEDCDLAYRLHFLDLKTLLVFNAVIYHDRTTKSLSSSPLNFFKTRTKKSRLARSWSFRNQHFIFIKHFLSQDFLSKIVIFVKILTMFVFSLIFEQFLLKEYKKIYLFWKN
ncbi:glycosyltransferase family 2 protein [Candidatus Falkowbacteria bacterium]|nr:glycosyltransferase family 2 protein [Candidatus Falkowbacteria bacterium]NCT54670.1 glycosyltransferase family 2 protein [Candidatus Falkowbacteria bacterium]